MENKNNSVRVTVDLPQNLEQKITELSKNERRSRQSQIVYLLERSFEGADGKKEKTK